MEMLISLILSYFKKSVHVNHTRLLLVIYTPYIVEIIIESVLI